MKTTNIQINRDTYILTKLFDENFFNISINSYPRNIRYTFENIEHKLYPKSYQSFRTHIKKTNLKFRF